MTITYWSVFGRHSGGGPEYYIEVIWSREGGYVMTVNWRGPSSRDWIIRPAPSGSWRGEYGPYRDLKAAVRAAKRQQKRLEAERDVVFDAPKVYETAPMP